MSPLARVRISALISATIIVGGFVFWMTVHFNVPWSNVHWWLFGFLWFPVFAGFMIGSTWHEALRSMDRKDNGSDVFHYIERE